MLNEQLREGLPGALCRKRAREGRSPVENSVAQVNRVLDDRQNLGIDSAYPAHVCVVRPEPVPAQEAREARAALDKDLTAATGVERREQGWDIKTQRPTPDPALSCAVICGCNNQVGIAEEAVDVAIRHPVIDVGRHAIDAQVGDAREVARQPLGLVDADVLSRQNVPNEIHVLQTVTIYEPQTTDTAVRQLPRNLRSNRTDPDNDHKLFRKQRNIDAMLDPLEIFG